jgi:branched-chain amino acid transport system permease protein
LLLALASGALLGFLTERLCLRPLIGQPLFSSFLMTFGIFMFLDGVLQLILKGRTWGLPSFLPTGTITVGGAKLFVGDLVSFAICLAMFLMTMLIFRYTKFGLGMRATAESHQLAQSVGINVRTIFSMVWILSAIVAVVAGITAARVMDIYFPLPWLIAKGLVVAMVGGLDSLGGALVAGLVLGLLENVTAGYLDPIVGGGIKEVAAYVLLLFILLVSPQGLFGLIRIKRV